MKITLKELILRAVERDDAQAAAAAADHMRYRMGLTYGESFRIVKNVVPMATEAEWDALLREAE